VLSKRWVYWREKVRYVYGSWRIDTWSESYTGIKKHAFSDDTTIRATRFPNYNSSFSDVTLVCNLHRRNLSPETSQELLFCLCCFRFGQPTTPHYSPDADLDSWCQVLRLCHYLPNMAI
jgi:hypothetical protein